jgi:pantoate--beta-alanine ligase
MDVLTTVAEVQAWRATHDHRATLGLVPTMGYLHAGHRSLVQRAADQNPWVAASIFVNPTQFGPTEDLATYPRDLPRDLALLDGAGCHMVFTPEPGEIYPPGFDTWVLPGAVAEPLEGRQRPNHFRGVATVVLKLFGILQPTRAYFGQKDAQQLAVIRAMVRDLNVPVTVVACPTQRESDGLALSSRNVYLAPDERCAAPVLFRALTAAQSSWLAGVRDADALRETLRTVLAEESLAQVDYVSVADPETLAELTRVDGPALASLAVRIGTTRLIDNLILSAEPEEI